MQIALPVVFVPGAGVALVLLLIFSIWHLRHAGLAVLTVLAPLPGVALAVLPPGDVNVLGYLAGYTAASFLASAIASASAAGRKGAVGEAWRVYGIALLCGFLLMGVAPFLPLVNSNMHRAGRESMLALGAVACGLGAAVFLSAGAFLLRYGEGFVTRANRALEIRARWLGDLGFVSQPRWGWSFSGIALVFSAVGLFGARDGGGAASLGGQVQIAVPVALLFVLAVAFLATRDFRRALSVPLTLVPIVLLVLWLSERAKAAVPPSHLLLAFAVALIPVLVMAARGAALQRQGDSAAVATTRALEQCGGATVFTAATATALAVSYGFTAAALVQALALLLGSLGALMLQPALATMLYGLFPKRVSLDAYRAR